MTLGKSNSVQTWTAVNIAVQLKMRLSPTGLIYYTKDKSVLFSPRLKYRDILYFTTDKCEITFNWSSNHFNTLCMWRSWCERWDTNTIHYLWGQFLKYYAVLIGVLCIWVHLYVLLNSLMEETENSQWDCWLDQVNNDSESIIKRMIEQLIAPTESKLKFCYFLNKSPNKCCYG